MSVAAKIRESFPEGIFGAPCTVQQITEAEQKLGHALPQVLKELYLAFNGFLGPADSQFFYPLHPVEDELGESLVGFTLFLRMEEEAPEFLKRAVAIGNYGGGTHWLILLDKPNQLVQWDATWGEDYEEVDGGVVDAWREAKALYEDISGAT